MKKYGLIFIITLCSFAFFSCTSDVHSNNEVQKTHTISDSVGKEMIDLLSEVRPNEKCMSEKEAMTEAANYAIKSGMATEEYLDSIDSELKNSSFADPVFEYIPQEDGSFTGLWNVYAVDDNDNMVANNIIRADTEYIGANNCDVYVGGSDRSAYGTVHMITKNEVEDLISYQFPGEEYSEPVLTMINPSESLEAAWYFAVGDIDGSGSKGIGNIREYLLDPYVKNCTKKIDYSKSLSEVSEISRCSSSFYASRLSQIDEHWGFYKVIEDSRVEKDLNGNYTKSLSKGINNNDYNFHWEKIKSSGVGLK